MRRLTPGTPLGDVLVLVLLVVALDWRTLFSPAMPFGLDIATFFLPMFDLLGASLKQGVLLGWSPYQGAGLPFLADPQTGYGYLPTMVLFGLLPSIPAMRLLMAGHLLLAVLGTYALARRTGMGTIGGLTAAISFGLGAPMFKYQNDPAFLETFAPLPLLLWAAHGAVSSSRSVNRFRFAALAGFLLGQQMQVWAGQGTLYVSGLLAAFTLYQAVVHNPFRDTLLRLGAVSGAGAAAGLLLNAWSLLPKLSYLGMSSLATGYSATETQVIGGLTAAQFPQFLAPGIRYIGAIAITLALLGILSRRNREVGFWAVVLGLTTVLALHTVTPLHRLLSIVPSIGSIHLHYPDRILAVAYLAVAVLAGWGVASLRTQPRIAAAAAAAAGAAGLVLSVQGLPQTLVLARSALILLVLILAVVLAWRPVVSTRGAVAAWLVPVALILDLLINNWSLPSSVMPTANPGEYVKPSAAAQFLLDQQAAGRMFRFWGLSWVPGSNPSRAAPSYLSPSAGAVLVWQQATLYRLQDTALVNPAHIARYDEFVVAVNAARQDYHGGRLFDRGLRSSRLSALLSVRYIPAPAARFPDAASIRALGPSYSVAARTEDTVILENLRALPRAWTVHDYFVAGDAAVLGQINAGRLNPATTAAVARDIGPLGRESASDRVDVTAYEPDAIRVTVTASSSALLVMSELYFPGWTVTVDGTPAEAEQVDYLLRGVKLEAGTHEVVWRYTAPGLKAGVVLSLLALVSLLLVELAHAVRARRRSTPGSDSAASSRGP